tara:strand:+ start:530 stop:1021 length:492 start_codon:yes stop_codon:yes gene_type:complete
MTETQSTEYDPESGAVQGESGYDKMTELFSGKGEEGVQKLSRLDKQVKIISSTLSNLDGRLSALEKLIVSAVSYQKTFSTLCQLCYDLEQRIATLEKQKAAGRFNMEEPVSNVDDTMSPEPPQDPALIAAIQEVDANGVPVNPTVQGLQDIPQPPSNNTSNLM